MIQDCIDQSRMIKNGIARLDIAQKIDKRDLIASNPKLMFESVGQLTVVKLRDEEDDVSDVANTTQQIAGYIVSIR